MQILGDSDAEKAIKYLDLAASKAKESNCFRAKCGTIIVSGERVIGSGFNSPPLSKKIDHCIKGGLPKDFKSDKTCCMHAEQRAIMDSLRKNPRFLSGSRLYFVRLDKSGKKEFSGEPYCTICSKMALDAGVSEFVLWRKEGVCVYDTAEYNELSFKFKMNPSKI